MSLPQRSEPLLPGEVRSPRTGIVVRTPARRHVRRHVRHQGAEHRGVVLERGMMLVVNGVIGVIAMVTIIQLLPHNASQQRKLQALEAEVNALDHRVNRLRDEFVLYFDPQQASSNIRALSDRLEPGQRKIILSDPAPEVENDALDPSSDENIRNESTSNDD